MNIHQPTFRALVMCALLGSAKAATFSALGTVGDENEWMNCLAISADGSTAIGHRSIAPSAAGEDARAESFRWTAEKGIEDIPREPGQLTLFLRALSSDGSVVVGESMVPDGTSSRWFAFRLAAAGVDFLGALDGTRYSKANGVSGDGSIVVGNSEMSAINGSSHPIFPFQWTNESMTALPVPSEASGGQACGISTDGSTIVGCYQSVTLNVLRAVYWRSGMMHELPAPSDQQREACATLVNPDGTVIVGNAGFPERQWNAVRWVVGKTSVDNLGNFGPFSTGVSQSEAKGLSADGAVIVGTSPDAVGNQAFIWTKASGLQCLQDVLESYYGLDLSGWTLHRAEGISANGSTIVGDGIDPQGTHRAWIATGISAIPKLQPEIDYSGARHASTTFREITLRGTAKNVSMVRYKIGSSSWKKPSGKKKWIVKARLRHGVNRILIRGNGRKYGTSDSVRVRVERKKRTSR